MNTEMREVAAQVSSEQTEGAFLRVWTQQTEKQETAEYLGCGCNIAAL